MKNKCLYKLRVRLKPVS